MNPIAASFDCPRRLTRTGRFALVRLRQIATRIEIHRQLAAECGMVPSRSQRSLDNDADTISALLAVSGSWFEGP
jgi:hypothetical protein